MAEGPEGPRDRLLLGRRRRLSVARVTELAEIVETGPDPATDAVRWRRIDLHRVIEERFGVVFSERAISDLLDRLASSHISPRPQHHERDERAIEDERSAGDPGRPFRASPRRGSSRLGQFAQAPRPILEGRSSTPATRLAISLRTGRTSRGLLIMFAATMASSFR